MREMSLILALLMICGSLAMFGCADSKGNIYDIYGSYLGNVSELVTVIGAYLLIKMFTAHFGGSHTSQADPAASNYCFFSAEQVYGSSGEEEQIFVEGTFAQSGNRVTANLASPGARSKDSGDEVSLNLIANGNTLSGTIEVTRRGTEYTGDISVEKAEE